MSSEKPGKKSDFSNLRLLLGSICLRRQQSFPSSVEVIRPMFSDDERKNYRTLAVVCNQALLAAVNSKNSKASHQNVLEKLLRLREFCDGINSNDTNNPEHVFSLLRQSGETCCYYCSVEILDLDTLTTAEEGTGGGYLTECRKVICSDLCCTSQYVGELEASQTGPRKCPICGTEHVTDNMLRALGSSENTAVVAAYPSKLAVLLANIKENMASEKWYGRPPFPPC
jgi:uncharacterized Zn-finger protein